MDQPDSPEELLEMIGTREEMRDREDGDTRRAEKVARDQIDPEAIKKEIEEYEEPPVDMKPPPIAQSDRPIGSPFEEPEIKAPEIELGDSGELEEAREILREKIAEAASLPPTLLRPSGYRTKEEHDSANKADDRVTGSHHLTRFDRIRPKGEPIGEVSEPDADVMGYLHSRYGVKPGIRSLEEVYDVEIGVVRLAFEPGDEWYYEVETIGTFDCGHVSGELSGVCDHVDEIARSVLEGSISRF